MLRSELWFWFSQNLIIIFLILNARNSPQVEQHNLKTRMNVAADHSGTAKSCQNLVQVLFCLWLRHLWMFSTYRTSTSPPMCMMKEPSGCFREYRYSRSFSLEVKTKCIRKKQWVLPIWGKKPNSTQRLELYIQTESYGFFGQHVCHCLPILWVRTLYFTSPSLNPQYSFLSCFLHQNSPYLFGALFWC